MLPPGRLPDDRRLGPLVDLNGYFPLVPSASKDAWKEPGRAFAAAIVRGLGPVAHARERRLKQ